MLRAPRPEAEAELYPACAASHTHYTLAGTCPSLPLTCLPACVPACLPACLRACGLMLSIQAKPLMPLPPFAGVALLDGA